MKFRFISFIVLLLCIQLLYSKETVSEGVNPFNEFMKPDGGVDLLSGNVSFPLPLVSVPGVNGMDINVAMAYSGNVHTNVRVRNDFSPTGWVGLGWRLNFGSIMCEHNATRSDADDKYYYISEEGVWQRIYRNSEGKFFLEKEPYWHVERFPENLAANNYEVTGWILTNPAGKKYIYGNPDGTTADFDAVRHTYRWGESGFIGEGYSGTPYLYPYQWDLAQIRDMYGNRVNFEYDTFEETITYESWVCSRQYTKESYVRKISTPQNDSVVFYTSEKDSLEYVDPKNSAPEPDQFIELFERRKLDSVVVYVNGSVEKKLIFCYKSINIRGANKTVDASDQSNTSHTVSPAEPFQKRLLISVEELNHALETMGRTVFEYYDEVDKFYEHLGKNDESDQGYNLGALKRITFPRCAAVEFEYTQQFLNNSKLKIDERDLDINLHRDAKILGTGILDNGSEYIVFSQRIQRIDKTDRHKDIHTCIWNGTKWIERSVPNDHPWGIRGVYCNGNIVILRGGSETDTATSSDGLAMYFWNKVKQQWDLGPTMSIDISSNVALGDKILYLWRYGIRTYLINEDERTSTYIATLKDVGEDYAYSIAGGFVDDDKVKLAKYTGEGWYEQIYDISQNGFHETEAYVGPDYCVFSYRYTNGDEYICVFKWFGNDWKQCGPIRIKRGKDMEIYPGNDYFVVKHPTTDNFSLFTWNGVYWHRQEDNVDLDSKGLDIKTGNNMFGVNYSKYIKGKCNNNRLKEKFRIYQFDGKQWKLGAWGRMGLSEKAEKQFAIGNNFFIAKSDKTSMRDHRAEFVPNSIFWDGTSWSGIQGRVFDFSTGRPDAERVNIPELFAVNNVAAGGMWASDWRSEMPHRCEDGYISSTSNYAKLFFAKKFKDSFMDKVSSYVVTRKIIYDGVFGIANNASVENGSIEEVPGVEVVTYTFDKEKRCYIETAAGTAFYEESELVREDGSRTRYSFLVDKEAWYPDFIGANAGMHTYDKNGRLTGYTINHYDTTHMYHDPDWPYVIQQVQLRSVSSMQDNVVSTVEIAYNSRNGLPAQRITRNSDGTKRIETTAYAFEADGGIYDQMAVQNMLSQVCQTVVYEKSDETPVTDADARASQVTQWIYDTGFQTYVPFASYALNSQSQPPVLRDFDFDDYDGQEGWQMLQRPTKYCAVTGRVLEVTNAKGVPSATFYGHRGGVLKIADVSHAHYDECAFFPADYDNHESDGGIAYFDLRNGWKKGGSGLVGDFTVRHCADSVVWVQSAQPGPNTIIEKIDPAKSYIFSAWIYPLSVSQSDPVILGAYKNGSPADIAPDDAYKYEMNPGKWTWVSRTITPQQLAGFTAQDYLRIAVSSGGSAHFYVEDIRFHPLKTFPTTLMYDTTNKLIATIDGYGNNICYAYDSFDRKIKEFQRGGDGVDTVYAESDYHWTSCMGFASKGRLSKLEISDGEYTFDPSVSSYKVIVGNLVDEVTVTAGVNDFNSRVSIRFGDTEIRSACPCGDVTAVVPLEPGNETLVEVDVEMLHCGIVRTTQIRLKRENVCWVATGTQTVAADLPQGAAMTSFGSRPVVGYIDKISGAAKVYAMNFTTETWDLVGNAALSSSASLAELAASSSYIYGVYIDNSDGHRLKIKRTFGTSGSWSSIGSGFNNYAFSNSAVRDAAVVITSSYLYIAYIADMYAEEGITPPQEGDVLYRIYFKAWDGNYTYTLAKPNLDLPSPEIINTQAFSLELDRDDENAIYCAYRLKVHFTTGDDVTTDDDNPDKLFVQKYQSGSWSVLGATEVTGNPVERFSFAVQRNSAGSDIAFVAYSELFSEEQSAGFSSLWDVTNRVRVRKLDAGVWTDLGDTAQGVIPAQGKEHFDLVFSGSAPLLTFTNAFNRFDATTVTWHDNTWRTYGNPAYAPLPDAVSVMLVSSTASDNMPYVGIESKNKNGNPVVLHYNNDCPDANVVNLTVTSSAEQLQLYPRFKQYIVNYAAQVSSGVSKVMFYVEPRAEDEGGTVHSVKINGTTAAHDIQNHVWSAEVNLKIGMNKVPVVVTASDEETAQRYTVTLIRPPSGSASLCGFDLLDNTKKVVPYTPDFNPVNFDNPPYTATVPYTVEHVYIRPDANNGPWISVNGDHNPSGYLSNKIPLHFGKNIVPIVVKSPDEKETVTYRVVVNRQADPNASLTNLTVQNQTLDPVFSPHTFEYTVEVSNATSTITLIPEAATGVTIYVNNSEVASGALHPLDLAVGVNYIRIKTVDSDGQIFADYMLKAIRIPGTDCSLDNIVFNPAITLTPAFSSGTLFYKAVVDHSVSSIEVTPLASDPDNAVVAVDDFALDIDNPAAIKNLITGANILSVRVGALNGNQASYQFSITRQPEIKIPKAFFVDAGKRVKESVNGHSSYLVAIDVDLTSAPIADGSVKYRIKTDETTATQGADFTLPGTHTLEFDLCEAKQPLYVQILDDDSMEPEEHVVIELYDPVNITLGSTAKIDLVIVDDDLAKVSFVQQSSEVVEGNTGQETVKDIDVVMDVFPSAPVNVYYRIYHQSPELSSSEFALLGNGQVTFTPSDKDEVIQVKVFGDNTYENDEYLTLELVPPENIGLGTYDKHHLTIKNDDAVVSFMKAAESFTEGEYPEYAIGVTLFPAPPQQVTVPLVITGTASMISDYLVSEPEITTPPPLTANLVFEPGQSVKYIRYTDENDQEYYEPDETIIVTLQTPQPANAAALDPQKSVYTRTIVENDVVGAVIYVDKHATGANNGSSWKNAFVKLQDALGLAEQYQNTVTDVHIAQGTYYPDEGTGVFDNDPDACFTISHGITLKGGFAPGGTAWNPKTYETVLSGDIDQNDNESITHLDDPNRNNSQNAKNIITCPSNVVTTIEGITIKAGYAYYPGGYGAAVKGSGKATLINCCIRDNLSESSGNVNNPLYVESCIFEHNATPTPMYGNNSGGGAIYAENMTITRLYGCTFTDNFAYFGGAVLLQNCEVVIEKCIFKSNNRAAVYASGPYLPKIVSCMFIDNNNDSEGGGAIELYAGTHAGAVPAFDMVNSLFYNNVSNSNGGAVYLDGSGTTRITNCNFVNNSSGSDGGALSINNSKEVFIYNSIFKANTDNGSYPDIYKDAAATLTIDYCLVQQPDLIINNNITGNPGFISQDQTSQDFMHLQQTSPCINYGTNSPVSDVPKDLSGETDRVIDGTVDLGVYESQY